MCSIVAQSNWSVLAPGSSGQFLQTQGASANPQWASASGSGTVNSGTAGYVAYYAGTGTAVSGETLTALIDAAIGKTQGDVLYRGASTWSVLAPGSSGQFLQTQGASANPQWASASGSGTVNSGTAGYITYYASTGTAVSGEANILVGSSGQLILSGISTPGTQVAGGDLIRYGAERPRDLRWRDEALIPRLIFSPINTRHGIGDG